MAADDSRPDVQHLNKMTYRRVLARRLDSERIWNDVRGRYLTASRFPTAVGLNASASPEVLRAIYAGTAQPSEPTWPMRLGTHLEPVVIDYFRDSIDRLRTNARQALFAHESLPWLAATPDGWCLEDGRLCAVEVKTTATQRFAMSPEWATQAMAVAEVIGARLWRVLWAEPPAPGSGELLHFRDTGAQLLPLNWPDTMAVAEEFAASVWRDKVTMDYRRHFDADESPLPAEIRP